MSVILVFSDEPDDDWMLANRIFFWFESLIVEAYPADAAVLEEVEIASAFSGYFLHRPAKDEPEVLRRFIEALRTTAESVARGDHPIPDRFISDPCDSAQIKARFAELAARLRAFEAAAGRS